MNFLKKHILYACVLASSVSLTSCDKNLDNVRKDVLTDENQWATESNADIAVNDVYDQVPDMYGVPETLDHFTDDNDPDHYYSSWKFKGGIIDPASTTYGITFGAPSVGVADIPGYNWPQLYKAIRKCNNTMLQITNNKNHFSAAWYNKRMDELRFHRAFHYSILLQNWGGVPLVTNDQTRDDSAALFLKRNTFAETLDFITKSLDTILTNKYLAVKYSNGDPDAGRVTLGAALMLKAYMQLVAASPLHNSTTYPAGPDPNKFVTFGNVDNTRWATAAASFKKFMDDWGGPGKSYDLVADDSTIWYENKEYNPEVIFDRQYVSNVKGSSLEYYGGVVYPLGAYATWGNYNPTQELVDQFFMANGKPITDLNSGYNPQKPYVGREPRFYKWIVYDGAPYKMDWMTATDTVKTRVGSGGATSNEIDRGLNDPSNTGYFFKKKLNPPTRPAQGASGANYIYFRYTEVLLGYAEAINEAGSPDLAYSAINAIRARAGLGPLPGGLSQSQMRDAIRQERRVELCFENKRLFDIKRWKIGEQVLTTDLHGMRVELNNGVLTYTPVGLSDQTPYKDGKPWSTTIHPHSFVAKEYMQPIPVPVINQNPNLVQNPGY